MGDRHRKHEYEVDSSRLGESSMKSWEKWGRERKPTQAGDSARKSFGDWYEVREERKGHFRGGARAELELPILKQLKSSCPEYQGPLGPCSRDNVTDSQGHMAQLLSI